MELGEEGNLKDGGGGGIGSSISCSICFEAVADNGERSRAKLLCGHEFHLDCIGSAFNMKGAMQCPNCRKIEKGQWLYANGNRSVPEYSMEDWAHDEDIYDLSYSEMPFGIHWCPFSGLTRVPSSFEEGESPPNAYHDLLGHHAIYAESVPSASHSCPYFAFFQPLQPSSSNTNESAGDGPSFSHHWSGLSGPSEISTSHTFNAFDVHYHNWDHLFSSVSNGTDQGSVPTATVRSSRNEVDGTSRSGSFVHPFLPGHGSGPRASSVAHSMVPPIPNGISRSHDRMQSHHAYPHQQHLNSGGTRSSIFSHIRRSGVSRGVAPVGPVASSSEHPNSYIVYPSSTSSGRNPQEADNPMRNRFYAWERDRLAPFPLVPVDRESSWWGSFHQTPSGSDSSSRSSSHWHRHGSERLSSQSRSDSSSYQVHPPGRMHPFI
ncbi:hypothetical protein Scep_009027 [Stephania cephalantha]|uniref:RING-type domain-containing protein n=1 Tax=Stephania cephalantha TaxID=152367 RepID=A0AAP0PFX1_9MAGN